MSDPEQLVAAVDDCGFDCRLQSVHNVDTEDVESHRLQVRRRPKAGYQLRTAHQVRADYTAAGE